MPLTAAEQAEMEYRDTYHERFQNLVELDEAAGGIIYVGFTPNRWRRWRS